MAFDWKALVKGIAPTIATALGGPLAGTATAAISRAVFGKDDATEEELNSTLASAPPETLLKIKEADAAFKTEMARLGIDLERVFAEDRADARQREIKAGDSWTPRILAAAVVTGYFAVQWFILSHIVPGEMREIVLRSLGVLDTALGLVLGYYFGSSRGSAAKDATIAGIMGGQK